MYICVLYIYIDVSLYVYILTFIIYPLLSDSVCMKPIARASHPHTMLSVKSEPGLIYIYIHVYI